MTDTTTTTQTTYLVRPHTDSMVPEHKSHRLAIIRWKASKKEPTKKVHASRAVSIPQVALTIVPECLAASLRDAFEDLQDEVLRNIIEQRLEKDPNVAPFTITDDDISPSSVAAYQAAQAANGRLSTDLLEAWFDQDLEAKLATALDTAVAAVADPANDEQVNQRANRILAAVKQHRDVITKLASPRASIPEKVATQLLKAVALADDSKVRTSLLTKLTAFSKPETLQLDELL